MLTEFVNLLPIDLAQGGRYFHEKQLLIQSISRPVEGASDAPLVCATREVTNELNLVSFVRSFEVQFQVISAAALTKQGTGEKGHTTALQTLLNTCGLSLLSASSELLGRWSHSRIDRGSIDRWVEQFKRVKLGWLAEVILGSFELIDPPALGNMFAQVVCEPPCALCFNKDPRGTSKSGDVIANLLTKRNTNGRLYDSLAGPIEDVGLSRAVVFEDGLWSGTEAIGIIESLQGRRPPEKRKTRALNDPANLQKAEITFAYGVATDYGIAVVERYMYDAGLPNVHIKAARTVNVASPLLLQDIKSGRIVLDERMREYGPPAAEVCPHIVRRLRERGIPAEQVDAARHELSSLGAQLLSNYLAGMVASSGWTMWAKDRIESASLGQHGLGLTHGFSHSVPKASLPLLWAGGDVTLLGKEIAWKALFENAI